VFDFYDFIRRAHEENYCTISAHFSSGVQAQVTVLGENYATAKTCDCTIAVVQKIA